MIGYLEIGGRRIWFEYRSKIRRVYRYYELEDKAIGFLHVKEVVEGIEIVSTIEERELASMITRDVAFMIHELGLEEDEIVKRIAETYGMDEYDAKQFVEYAEYCLFR